MQDDSALAGQADLGHDLRGLVMRLAHMQRKRRVQAACQLKLLAEHLALHLARREVVVVVQADLAHAAANGLGQKALHGLTRLDVEVLGVVRVAPHQKAHLRHHRELAERVEHAGGAPSVENLGALALPAVKVGKHRLGVARVIGGVDDRHQKAHAGHSRTRKSERGVYVPQAREMRVALGDGTRCRRKRERRLLLRAEEAGVLGMGGR